ncbi:MAG: hypothetical protein IPP97_16165 [Candidatus Obscuribacter sp.]|jgi:hypothetical protein|nr:hypothetical protein [Candidatus Obscuribacter sp.]MBP6350199.1 hypothetical protein [Candidatus Obscuribacter sp.]MBP6593563.1 hypothetical protein [Candidatus Obscuribacter sp.]MBP7576600.1 hypothetical protein [Candidatus Obscuribacter sp.]
MKPGFQQSAAGLSQHILQNYRNITTTVRQDYLQYLTAKSQSYADSARSQQEQEAERTSSRQEQIVKSMTGLLDRVFHTLEAYALELNRVNSLKDLLLTAQPPIKATELSDYDHLRRPSRSVTYYRSRFSTRLLSLVIRGADERIDFYLIPTDRVIGLSRIEAEIEPLMTFSLAPQSDFAVEQYQSAADLAWQVEGKPLTADRMERYSLLALEHLLDSTQAALGLRR